MSALGHDVMRKCGHSLSPLGSTGTCAFVMRAAITIQPSRERQRRQERMSEAMELPERESMEFDVVIVGAGPAGLAAAIRL